MHILTCSKYVVQYTRDVPHRQETSSRLLILTWPCM